MDEDAGPLCHLEEEEKRTLISNLMDCFVRITDDQVSGMGIRVAEANAHVETANEQCDKVGRKPRHKTATIDPMLDTFWHDMCSCINAGKATKVWPIWRLILEEMRDTTDCIAYLESHLPRELHRIGTTKRCDTRNESCINFGVDCTHRQHSPLP